MTKEQFIKELEHIAESGSNEIRLGNLFDMVAAQSVREDRESRWISVKDRLPEFGTNVLIAFIGGLTGKHNIKVDYCYKYHGNPVEWKYTSAAAVTHWQPLPSPPINQ